MVLSARMLPTTIAKTTIAAVLLSLAPLPLAGAAAEAPAPDRAPEPAEGRVTLPLAEYLALVERAEARERQSAEAAARREAPAAEVVAQRTAVRLDGPLENTVELTASFEALVQGHPKEPLLLPFDGLAAHAMVRPLRPLGAPAATATAPASIAAADGGRGVRGLFLVAPAPGRYAVEVRGRAALVDQDGARRLTLAPVAAPVAQVEVDLPADLAWNAPGAVVIDERVEGPRRLLRLATPRGAAPVLDVRRHLAESESERLLAESVVLTLFQLRPDGLRRHDVVLYEVSRGGLASLTVDLPPGLEVEQVATDEGEVTPLVEARRLTVERRRQLRGTGYLVLTSTPRPGVGLAASPVVPTPEVPEVRARYLALASTVAARAEPAPAASWERVDLADLPPSLGAALRALDLVAAWRLLPAALAGPTPAGLSLSLALLPPAPKLPTLVRQRETTTLVTVDGTVLHRDRFVLAQAGAALDLALPAGAVLWSARVGEQPVRPVERQGRLSIPLGFAPAAAPPVVEVVAVAERNLPHDRRHGRSRLALALPEVAAPVVDHRWRLLLPDGARYRVRGGTLRPAGEPGEEESAPAIPRVSYLDRVPGAGAGLRGLVRLQNGDPAPGVTVELHSAARREPWVASMNGEGRFFIDGLPAGAFSVTASLEGFAPVEIPRLEIPADRLAYLELELHPTGIQETILVTGETTPLDRRTAERMRRDAEANAARGAFQESAAELKKGLVGGVKPLPVAIPESGKELLLAGALPPATVAVEIEVKR